MSQLFPLHFRNLTSLIGGGRVALMKENFAPDLEHYQIS